LPLGTTVIIERGQMQSFYPNQQIDLIFRGFPLNDHTATQGKRDAGVNFKTLYLNQMRRYYKDELNLNAPKVVFIGLTMSQVDSV
jgi:hypothetical protein